MEEELKGFSEVEKVDWAKIPKGSYIKYRRTDGKLTKGGELGQIELLPGKILRFEFINNYGNKWKVYSSSIKNIYKEKRKIIKQSDNSSEDFTKRITRLEEENKKLKNAVKQNHDLILTIHSRLTKIKKQ